MKKIVIDGKSIATRTELYAELRKQLGRESLQGSNLDALHDALTSLTEDTDISIENEGALRQSLGTYFDKLVKVIGDSQDENDSLNFDR